MDYKIVPIHKGIRIQTSNSETDGQRSPQSIRNTLVARSPQAMRPPIIPKPIDIKWQRQLAAMDKKRAAELCGVTPRTWTHWERGKRPMPAASWAWFRVVISGGILAGGPDWQEWSFWKGHLCSPEGWEYTVGDIRSIPHLSQLAAALEAQVRRLEQELAAVRPARPRAEQYAQAKAIGRVETLLQSLISVMNGLLEPIDDAEPVGEGMAAMLEEAMMSVAKVQVELIQRNRGNKP